MTSACNFANFVFARSMRHPPYSSIDVTLRERKVFIEHILCAVIVASILRKPTVRRASTTSETCYRNAASGSSLGSWTFTSGTLSELESREFEAFSSSLGVVYSVELICGVVTKDASTGVVRCIQ